MSIPESMLAQTFLGPNTMKIEGTPTPQAKAGEAIVRVDVALTCGTDLKIYRRGHPLVKPPQILGHEFAGTIVQLGKGVKRFKLHDRIVAVNSAPCKKCYHCKHQQPNLCITVQGNLLGFSLPGAYSEYIRIPRNILSQNAYNLPEGVPIQEMALLEPLACVIQGNDASGLKKGDTVAIIGGGPIGLLHVTVSKTKGAGRVICIDHHDAKLKLAQEFGADLTVADHGSAAVETVREVTEERGADVVIEATGRPESWVRAFEMVRKGGTVVFFGGCPTGTVIPFEAGKIHYGSVTIKGSFHHTPKSVKEAFRVLSQRKVSLASLISRRMPLADTEKALQMMGRGEALKIALTP
jgi:L-iditol 2-dehydrogenase